MESLTSSKPGVILRGCRRPVPHSARSLLMMEPHTPLPSARALTARLAAWSLPPALAVTSVLLSGPQHPPPCPVALGSSAPGASAEMLGLSPSLEVQSSKSPRGSCEPKGPGRPQRPRGRSGVPKAGELRIRQITDRQRSEVTAACWSHAGRSKGKEGVTDSVNCDC